MGELLIILVIVLLIFKGLKRGLNTDDDIEVTPKDKRVSDTSSAKSVQTESDVAEAEIVEKKS
jgi:hypothetical protein